MSEETKDSKNKEAVKKTTKAAEPKAAKKTTKPKAAKKTTKPKVEKKATKPKAEKKASKAVIEPKVEKEIIESDITVSNEQSEELQNTESTKEDSKSEDSSKEDFLNDFDWNLFEEGIETIKDEKLSEFEKLVEENFVDTYNESVIEGTIISLTDREAIIDINAKSEGVISLNEFRYNPDLKVGDKVKLYKKKDKLDKERISVWLPKVFEVEDIKREKDQEFYHTAEFLKSILKEIHTSPLHLMDKCEQLDFILNSLKNQSIPEKRAQNSLDIQGWLEVLWEDRPHLIMAGMNEGSIPNRIASDIFLPDSMRSKLGLRNNETVLARDNYIFNAALNWRNSGGRVDLILGKESLEGTPLKPSRLLFQCDDIELPFVDTKLAATHIVAWSTS